MNETSKRTLKFLAIVICVCLALSFFFHVPFIYTLCGLAAWMAFGHLITIDDDAASGFSNPGENKMIWRHSLLELLVKFGVLIFLCALAFTVPEIRSYGA
ncbi:hypothetical protein [Undibacterium sp.]|uniref:hypothetical protein n=1 Tax=Undibacterium sp. TaxID=1914977 RepID=UPI0025E6CC69|nr:hypothetical protein [Undibacterium sp.]